MIQGQVLGGGQGSQEEKLKRKVAGYTEGRGSEATSCFEVEETEQSRCGPAAERGPAETC